MRGALPSGRSRVRALSALVAALLLAAAPILVALHASEALHRYCAEHGVVEEASAEGEPSSAGLFPSESTAAHEACAAARVCRYGEIPHAVPLHEGRAPTPPAIVAPALRIWTAAIAVIVTAPKTSPPSAWL